MGGVQLNRDEIRYYQSRGSHWTDPWAELGAYLYYGSTELSIAPSERYPNLWNFYDQVHGEQDLYVGYWIDLANIWKYTGTKSAFADRTDLFDRMIKRPIWSTQSGLRGRWVIVQREGYMEDHWRTLHTYDNEVEYNAQWDRYRIASGVPAE